jgi:hypothetical protein
VAEWLKAPDSKLPNTFFPANHHFSGAMIAKVFESSNAPRSSEIVWKTDNQYQIAVSDIPVPRFPQT